MRIRVKLIVLHTCFSLALAGILALAMRPAIAEVVRQAEVHEASAVLSLIMSERAAQTGSGGGNGAPGLGGVASILGPGVDVRSGAAQHAGLDAAAAARARQQAAQVSVDGPGGVPIVGAFDPVRGEYVSVSVRLDGARGAVVRLYVLLTVALLAVYALVAAALEIFVLPQHVYGPIRTMLDADRALQEGRRSGELIATAAMPADELGEIMRSRNRSITALREHERDLAAAMLKIEEVATDLKRKNHLLEMARRNMADTDRLASLGLMSAGIAHELNTPLAVLKGLVERLNKALVPGAAFRAGSGPSPVTAEEAALMLRVVGRLERLSESLLDFARVRPPRTEVVALRPLVDEAWTLVRLDRSAERVQLENRVSEELRAACDADRIVQVLVNLLRNGVDAMIGDSGEVPPGAMITVSGERGVTPHGGSGAPGGWAAIRISDNGPGIDPDLLSRLFEPFASTRLDSKGTGLGLAVAEGIVREHGGVLLARNRSDGPRGRAGESGSGAVFEIVLPDQQPVDSPDASVTSA